MSEEQHQVKLFTGNPPPTVAVPGTHAAVQQKIKEDDKKGQSAAPAPETNKTAS